MLLRTLSIVSTRFQNAESAYQASSFGILTRR
jgi:hypothetical protein